MNIEDTTADIPDQLCPSCGVKLNSATAAYATLKVKPVPGNFSVCIECGELLRFTKDLKLAAVSPEEMAKLPTEVLAIVLEMKQLIFARFLQQLIKKN